MDRLGVVSQIHSINRLEMGRIRCFEMIFGLVTNV